MGDLYGAGEVQEEEVMEYQAAFEKLKEEKDALLKDKDYLIQQQADEIERLRRDVKKQQEKMIDLARARELKEMEEVKTWCHQRGIAMVEWPIYQSMVACLWPEAEAGKMD